MRIQFFNYLRVLTANTTHTHKHEFYDVSMLHVTMDMTYVVLAYSGVACYPSSSNSGTAQDSASMEASVVSAYHLLLSGTIEQPPPVQDFEEKPPMGRMVKGCWENIGLDLLRYYNIVLNAWWTNTSAKTASSRWRSHAFLVTELASPIPPSAHYLYRLWRFQKYYNDLTYALNDALSLCYSYVNYSIVPSIIPFWLGHMIYTFAWVLVHVQTPMYESRPCACN